MNIPDAATAYVPLRRSRSKFIAVRSVRYHVREWGPENGPALLLLHGARDSSASYQFVVDALSGDWRVVAPDLRGHGLTSWTPGNYWLSDFLSDIDALWDVLFPKGPVALVGHSMGGNIAALYAGVRPGRVAQLMMLDALGNVLNRSPVRIADTLVEFLDAQAPATKVHTYGSLPEMAERMTLFNRRLDATKAAFLVAANARRATDGRLAWPHDPNMRGSWPTIHSTEEWGECWRRIEAPVLCLLSSDPRPTAATSFPHLIRERSAYFSNLTYQIVPETGHNVHHDAPVFVARAIDKFARGAMAHSG